MMEIYEIEGKTEEEINAKLKDKDYIILNTSEEKGSLFKGKKSVVKYVLNEEVIEYIKETIDKLTNMMGLKVQIEVKHDDIIKFNLYSDNNSILIGKDGKNIKALQIVLKQIIYNNLGRSFAFSVDVENYKENKKRNIEYIAKRTAKEVFKTKIETKLTDMNAYERRIVHTVLSDFDGIYTESEGEEPNRCVVIKISE